RAALYAIHRLSTSSRPRASPAHASCLWSNSRARSAKVRITCVSESPARSSLVRAGGEGGGGGGGGSWDGAAGRVTAVAAGLQDGATGVGFAAGRAATGGRRRRPATRPTTLSPRAETLAPIVDATAVMLDHWGSSGWNHQYAPAATPPNKSTSRVRITARGSLSLRRGARSAGASNSWS